MDIFSELNRAQAENIATDPTPSMKGRFYYKNAAEPLKVDDGVAIHSVVTDLNYATLLPTYVSAVATHAAQSGAVYKNLVSASKGWGTLQDTQDITTYGRLVLRMSGDNALKPFYIRGADLPTVTGLTTKLRLSVNLHTNDTNITSTMTIGLYPVTRPAIEPLNSNVLFSLGTMVPGSNVPSFISPGPKYSDSKVSLDFNVPADGFYIIALSQTAAIVNPLYGYVLIDATLQTRNA